MARLLILNITFAAIIFAFLAAVLPALGLRDEIKTLRCDVIAYAESRGTDLGDIERCEE